MTLQVTVNASKKQRIHEDMIVIDDEDSVGIVTEITKKWVHVFMLIKTEYLDEEVETETQRALPYHNVRLYPRSDLRPAPVGYSLQIKQREIA